MREVDVVAFYRSAREGAGIRMTTLALERIVPLHSPSLVEPAISAAVQIAASR